MNHSLAHRFSVVCAILVVEVTRDMRLNNLAIGLKKLQKTCAVKLWYWKKCLHDFHLLCKQFASEKDLSSSK